MRRRIEKRPDVSTAALYEEAIRIDPSVKRRSLQSFFGTYVQHAKRALNAQKRSAEPTPAALAVPPSVAPAASRPVHAPPARPSGGTSASEDLLRRILTDVAQQAMRAQSRTEFLDLLARIDRHAKEVAEAVASQK